MADKWILERYRQTANDVTRFLGKYELGEAARSLYDFSWNEFCDWYIELAKQRLYKETGEEKHTAQFVLTHVLSGIMQLLHPFMPFITEEIWQHLPENKGTIMRSPWPDSENMDSYPREEEDMNLIMDLVRSVRNIRGEMNVPLGKKIHLILLTNQKIKNILEKGQGYITGLCQAETVEFFPPNAEKPEQAAAAVIKGIEIFIPLKGIIDLDKEIARLEKEVAHIDKELARLQGKLNNKDFLVKAPVHVVEKEKAKKDEYSLQKKALVERLTMIKG